MKDAQLAADYANLQRVMDRIPPEILFMYSRQSMNQDKTRDPER